VRPTGAKAFVAVYRAGRGRGAPVRKQTIGAVGKLTPDQAREEAARVLAGATLGADPAGELAADRAALKEEKSAPTVAEVLDRFVSDHVDVNLKPKTAYDYRRLVNVVLKPRIGDKKARALAPKDVAEMHHALRATRVQADQAVRVLSSAMNLAETWGLRDPGSNPCGIRKNGSRRRERLFSDVEVARLLNATDQLESAETITKAQALAVRLLFATGCRAGEICGLEWGGVDFDEGVILWPDTKTGALVKPMTTEARELLKRAVPVAGVPFVAPSPALKMMRVEVLEGAFERVMKHAKVPARENATCHLVRHWFCTKVYSDPTIALPEQMRICGHKSVATAMRYAQTVMDAVKAGAEASAKKRAAALEVARTKLKGKNVLTLKAGG
jgi:integrase